MKQINDMVLKRASVSKRICHICENERNRTYVPNKCSTNTIQPFGRGVKRKKRTYVRNMRSERIAFKHVLCYYVKQLDEAFVDKIGFVQG